MLGDNKVLVNDTVFTCSVTKYGPQVAAGFRLVDPEWMHCVGVTSRLSQSRIIRKIHNSVHAVRMVQS